MKITKLILQNSYPMQVAQMGQSLKYLMLILLKKKGIDKVSKQFQAELTDLQKKIKSFVSEAADTQKVYSANFKFEPVVGESYFLYQGEKNTFLSLIEPNQWKKKYLGTFRLNSEYKWERI